MIQSAKFVKGLDIGEVVPGLSVCLEEAITTGAVKDIGVSAVHNGIDDVENVGGRVEDSFQAFDAMHGVQNDTSGVYVNGKVELPAKE